MTFSRRVYLVARQPFLVYAAILLPLTVVYLLVFSVPTELNMNKKHARNI